MLETQCDKVAIARLSWPLVTFDFEASSLEVGSYPIEVGACRWSEPGRPMETWSTLIRPLPAWLERGSWSSAAQAIHKIQRSELDAGMTCSEAVEAMNAIVGNSAAYCDGGSYDLMWLRMLARGSTSALKLKFGDIGFLKQRLGDGGKRRMEDWLAAVPAPHRAAADAERLMKAVSVGLAVIA